MKKIFLKTIQKIFKIEIHATHLSIKGNKSQGFCDKNSGDYKPNYP